MTIHVKFTYHNTLFLFLLLLPPLLFFPSKNSLTKRLEDEDDSDGGFKRRPKIRSSIAIDQRYSWTEPGIHIPLSSSSNQIPTMVPTPCLPLRPPSVICYESSNQHRHFLQQPIPSQIIANITNNASTLQCQAYNCSTSPIPITYHRYIGSNIIHPSDHRSIQYQVCSSLDAPSASGVIDPSSVTPSVSGGPSCNLLTQQQQSQLAQSTAATKCTMSNVSRSQEAQLYHSTSNVSQCPLFFSFFHMFSSWVNYSAFFDSAD